MMGSKIIYKVVSLGSIRQKIFDRMTKELTNVRHVPGFKRNLISLGALD